MFASRSSVLLALTTIFLTLFSIVDASPVERRSNDQNSNTVINQYQVPTTVGASTLPTPTGTLKAITLGRGTQNYTCATASGAPVSVGAKADLFDVTPLLKSITIAQGTQLLNLLPQFLIDFDLSLVQQYSIPVLGYHYFNRGGQPTFDLGSTGFLVAKKMGDIAAPSDACAGQFGVGYGAIDWLNLIDAGGSTGISEVYRVETAGGSSRRLVLLRDRFRCSMRRFIGSTDESLVDAGWS
ncbi:hypothetical protein OEA41_006623 [Lepraria neglecta]|uniref:Uncharacterized protein n=1 Tax=Lepraria neglecta TaxID=209136 RepID=A0AAD9Z812_9LECA|nr:hypothetical protein OEA41_006623 [Lepraria neglecta]